MYTLFWGLYSANYKVFSWHILFTIIQKHLYKRINQSLLQPVQWVKETLFFQNCVKKISFVTEHINISIPDSTQAQNLVTQNIAQILGPEISYCHDIVRNAESSGPLETC